MNQRNLLAIATAVLLVLACAVTGYLLGQAEAPSVTDWQEERLKAEVSARKVAATQAFAVAKERGRREGFQAGEDRGVRMGGKRGEVAGDQGAAEQLAAIEEEEQAQLEYVEELPSGDPGYLLPEEERTLSCIGISAVTGECVGD